MHGAGARWSCSVRLYCLYAIRSFVRPNKRKTTPTPARYNHRGKILTANEYSNGDDNELPSNSMTQVMNLNISCPLRKY